MTTLLFLKYNKSDRYSVVSNYVTPRTAAHEAPLSMEFFGKNNGVGCHALLQANFSDPGIELGSPAL